MAIDVLTDVVGLDRDTAVLKLREAGIYDVRTEELLNDKQGGAETFLVVRQLYGDGKALLTLSKFFVREFRASE